MKRSIGYVLAASMLISGTAFAAGDAYGVAVQKKLERIEQREEARRDHERRDRDHGRSDGERRDWDHDRRGHDRRDYDRRDYDRRDHDRRDYDRRDWDRNRHDRRGPELSRHDYHRGWDRHRRDWDNHPNYWDNRRHDRRDYARHRYHYGHYHAPHGYYYRTWHRGDRLPRAWYGHSYVVYDWRPYRLYAPPYGYHWVRVGDDVLLTAIATGVVLDVLYDIWY